MTVEQSYQKLAKHVIIQAYKDKAKNWIKNKWNFNLICGVANMIPEEVEKKFLNIEREKPLPYKGSKTKLARELGVSYATLDYWHKKLDSIEQAVQYIKSGNHKYNTHSKCDKYYDQIIKLRKEGMSWLEISQELDIGCGTVYGFAKKKNID